MSEPTSVGAFEAAEDMTVRRLLRLGVRYSPELLRGIWTTLTLALVSTAGQVVVPITIQQTIDKGLGGGEGADVGFVVKMGLLAAVATVATAVASYAMTARLFAAGEAGLKGLRVQAFRHVHDLPMLTQNSERRGALVARVTSDVDQISQFLVFGGVFFVISIGQMFVATAVMVYYSWQLAIIVWLAFAPLFVSLPYFQRKLSRRYAVVREKVGSMLSAISEPVVGASVVRAYGVQDRTQGRIDASINAHYQAQSQAMWMTAGAFSLGGVSGGIANAGVLVVGILLGVAGEISAGEVLAFAFVVTLFVGPVQMGTQILTDAQNAFAGWRRVIGILETPPDLEDLGEAGHQLQPGPIEVSFEDVSFAYPGNQPVLHDIDLSIAPGTRMAIVGETGSGKSTFAKLMTRLVDPTTGTVRLNGEDLRQISDRSLRASVVLVPQEGFLFDDTLRANLVYGRVDATDDDMWESAHALDLDTWLRSLPNGLDSSVGQRGESMSAGERQLIALVRAHLADPDLLVLDEATSAVDPGLEMRINRALERLMRGRTSVTIAHRLSSAEAADDVLVVDAGRIVQRGPHAQLVQEPGTYAELHASWVAQRNLQA